MEEGGGVSGGVGVPGGEGSALGWSPPTAAAAWPACVGGSGGGWLGAWRGGWLLEWRRGVAHGWAAGEVGEVGDWLCAALDPGLWHCGGGSEEAVVGGAAPGAEGWLGGGLVGLGGGGACFLVPGKETASLVTVSRRAVFTRV